MQKKFFFCLILLSNTLFIKSETPLQELKKLTDEGWPVLCEVINSKNEPEKEFNKILFNYLSTKISKEKQSQIISLLENPESDLSKSVQKELQDSNSELSQIKIFFDSQQEEMEQFKIITLAISYQLLNNNNLENAKSASFIIEGVKVIVDGKQVDHVENIELKYDTILPALKKFSQEQKLENLKVSLNK